MSDSKFIPDTDDVTVAMIAAALYFADAALEVPRSERHVDKLQRFVDAYEVIHALIGKGADEARARLDKIK